VENGQRLPWANASVGFVPRKVLAAWIGPLEFRNCCGSDALALARKRSAVSPPGPSQLGEEVQ